MRFIQYFQFVSEYINYKKLNLGKNIEISWKDRYPCLTDKTKSTSVDPHYFYQGIWAYLKIKESEVQKHTDIGSDIRWVGLLSLVTEVTFVDIRKPEIKLENLIIKKGNILDLPFKSNSVYSLSCLHVAEHVGLGRYGDRLDPEGTKKACYELARVLAPGGNLYFSVPVGKQKTYFNAHRVHYPQTILDYFKDLKLMELSGITDKGEFIENIDINILEKSDYACGLFWFKKP